MRFDCGDPLSKRLERWWQKRYYWQPWFAWRPVRVLERDEEGDMVRGTQCVWLERIERKCWRGDLGTEYRLPLNGAGKP